MWTVTLIIVGTPQLLRVREHYCFAGGPVQRECQVRRLITGPGNREGRARSTRQREAAQHSPADRRGPCSIASDSPASSSLRRALLTPRSAYSCAEDSPTPLPA